MEVAPEFGGRIHQIWVVVDGAEEALLSSPGDVESYAERPLDGGCYPMAPWPNRVAGGRFSWAGRTFALPTNDGGHALHGLVFDQPWEVVARVGRVVELRCELGDGWPWDAYAWQRIEIGETGLSIKVEARSRRDAFPAGVGLHPWFRRTVAGAEDATVRLPAESRYLLANQIPSGGLVPPGGDFVLDTTHPLGSRGFDDCYTGLEGPVVIDWGRVRLGMSVECPAPHVMVYTTPDAFCIEPQTCAPDAFNLRTDLQGTGFAVAEPGRAVGLVSRWRWSIM